VRASLPNPHFDQPRWHVDGHYYKLTTPFQVKFATALKGNTTPFYDLPHEMRDEFNAHRNDCEYLNTLIDLKNSESPVLGCGAFFIVGNKEYGAVHSEPKFDKPRLFFSILPGDEAEIKELYDNWYPQDEKLELAFPKSATD
jgi:hypothetical protein